MEKNNAHKHSVDDAIRWLPFAVSSNNHERDEHKRGTIVNGAKTTNKTESVAVSDQEAQWSSPAGRREVEGPVVQASACWHGTTKICHSQADYENEAAGNEPAPYKAGRPSGKTVGEGRGDRRKQSHDGECNA